MYGRGNVLVGKCPVGELSVRGNVCSGKCPSGKCPSGKCQSGNCPRGSVSRGTVQSGNCPHTLNFNEKHSNMLIYKTLEKSWILNILRKEFIFLYSKRIFFLMYRCVYFFRCDNFKIDISKKSNNLRKWWLNLFSFPLRGSRVKSEKKVTWKNISYSPRGVLLCKLNKTKRTNFHFTFVNDYPARYVAKIYFFKLNNRNTRKTCETCSKLTIKTREQC